jgi:hypothetical protein
MDILIPDGLVASLDALRAQRDAARAAMEKAGTTYRTLSDLIEKIEATINAAPEPPAPPILVEAGQFRGMKTPHAMMRVFLLNDRPLRTRDVSDALHRGGQQRDRLKIHQNVKWYFKEWKRAGYLEPTSEPATYKLTAEGREHFTGALGAEGSLFGSDADARTG